MSKTSQFSQEIWSGLRKDTYLKLKCASVNKPNWFESYRVSFLLSFYLSFYLCPIPLCFFYLKWHYMSNLFSNLLLLSYFVFFQICKTNRICVQTTQITQPNILMKHWQTTYNSFLFFFCYKLKMKKNIYKINHRITYLHDNILF